MLHCIKSHDQRILITSLKVIISPLSKTKSESESFTILFYSSPLNSTNGCIQMAITAAMVTGNVCMSRCWKAESVAYGIRKQHLPRFTHLLPLKPDHALVCPVCSESLQHPVLTSKSCNFQTVHWNRPYE
jgi:hypothetical protein